MLILRIFILIPAVPALVTLRLQAEELQVRVVTATNNSPLAGCNLKLSNSKKSLDEGKSDTDGVFRFVSLQSGSYSVQARCANYHSNTVETRISPGNAPLLIRLLPMTFLPDGHFSSGGVSGSYNSSSEGTAALPDGRLAEWITRKVEAGNHRNQKIAGGQ